MGRASPERCPVVVSAGTIDRSLERHSIDDAIAAEGWQRDSPPAFSRRLPPLGQQLGSGLLDQLGEAAMLAAGQFLKLAAEGVVHADRGPHEPHYRSLTYVCQYRVRFSKQPKRIERSGRTPYTRARKMSEATITMPAEANTRVEKPRHDELRIS